MSHSHSQILALPVAPPAVSARLDGMKEYFDKTGKCSICEILQEDLLIHASSHFISIVPFAATFPFEIWIIPRDHSTHFHEIDIEKVIIIVPLIYLFHIFIFIWLLIVLIDLQIELLFDLIWQLKHMLI